MTNDRNDDALDLLFDATRNKPPMPTPDFMARLEADAMAAMPRPEPPKSVAPVQPVANWFGNLFAASGLSGAAVAGLWLGFAMPESLDTLSLTTDDTIALSTFLPGTDLGAMFDE